MDRRTILAFGLLLAVTLSTELTAASIAVDTLRSEVTETSSTTGGPNGLSNNNCTLGEAILAVNRRRAVDGCVVRDLGGNILPFPANGPVVLELIPGGDYSSAGDASSRFGPTAFPVIGAALDGPFATDAVSDIVIEGQGASIDAGLRTAFQPIRRRVFAIAGAEPAPGSSAAQEMNLHATSTSADRLSPGRLTLRNLSLKNGTAPLNFSPGGIGAGGSIYNGGGTLRLEGCTLVSNEASKGGAIFSTDGAVVIINSTISTNSASEGGGIYARNGVLTVLSATLANTDGDLFALADQDDLALELRNNLMLGGGAQPSVVVDSINGGTVVQTNHAIVVRSSVGLMNATVSNNPSIIGPLTNYGGRTQTHPLLPFSPAINAGSNDFVVSSTDQRGAPFARLVGGRIDIGAFEVQPISHLEVASLMDFGGPFTLRQTIADAQTHNLDVRFAPHVRGTIFLSRPLPLPSIRIFGPGADQLTLLRTVSGFGGDQDPTVISTFQGTAATVSGLSVVSDSSLFTSGSGAIVNNGNLAVSGLHVRSRTGRAIENTGVLTLRDSTVSGSRNVSAAPILNGGTLTAINTTVSDNTFNVSATSGVLTNLPAATATLINLTVADNRGSGAGSAGLVNQGNMTLVNSIVANNSGAQVTGVLSQASRNNLASDASLPNSNGNLINADPRLGALQFNGGTTPTFALGANSPAINAGDSSVIAPPLFQAPPYTDQRGIGYARITGAHVDIGAFEAQGCGSFAFTPQTLPIGVQGQPYRQVFSALRATQPTAFTLGGTLPTGINLSAAGVLEGIPTTAGIFGFMLTVRDFAGCERSQQLVLQITERLFANGFE